MQKHFAVAFALLAVAGTTLAQQNGTVTLQEHMATSDSVTASVAASSGDIRAGEVFQFTVTLDKAPNFNGGNVGFSAKGPNAGYGADCVEDRKAAPHRVYHCSLPIPQTAQGGMWSIYQLVFREGSTSLLLKFDPINFRVIPKPGLIFPTSAEVTVNLDQQQLLRREAGHLQERIQQLKSAVSEYARANQEGALTPILRKNLKESVDALIATQAGFIKLTTDEGQHANAEVFFDDLRRNYEGVLLHLDQSKATAAAAGQLVRVSEKIEKPGTESLLALTLRPMEQNELAYRIVADEGTLTFDLEVDSTPEGAAISYYRKGDPPRPNPDQTRATIPKLPYAIWFVKLEKPGYKTQEIEHDPFRESNHVVHVDLQK